MKLMIASDIHGSAYYCERLLDAWRVIRPDRLLLLGDLLYHGPRNDLPRDYSTKRTAELLNTISGDIICVRGNCEADVDRLMLDFPITADNCLLYDDGSVMFATHGHVYNKDNPPKLHKGDILLHGHTHVPTCEMLGCGAALINPGSVSIPKNGSAHSYIIYETGLFTWHDMEKSPGEGQFMEWSLGC